jgi:putative hemolysin
MNLTSLTYIMLASAMPANGPAALPEPATIALLGACALVGIMMSGLFSGLETGVYSLNRVRLHLLTHQENTRAKLLTRLRVRPNALLTTLLIGTNVATNIATHATADLLHRMHFSDLQVIILGVCIITPMLFVFAETLPKDLFSAHADKWVYPFARLILMVRAVCAVILVLPAIEAISWCVMRMLGTHKRADASQAFTPRRQVEVLVKEGVGHGLLSDEQSAMVERVLQLGQRTVGQEMTPWSQTTTVDRNTGIDVLWQLADKSSLSRFPVVEAVDGVTNVVGVVNVLDALRHGRDTCPPISELMRSTLELPPSTPLRPALRTLQNEHAAMAVVVSDAGRPIGVVTIKDLVEPLTGDLAVW